MGCLEPYANLPSGERGVWVVNRAIVRGLRGTGYTGSSRLSRLSLRMPLPGEDNGSLQFRRAKAIRDFVGFPCLGS
jgi:hypothetical protein